MVVTGCVASVNGIGLPVPRWQRMGRLLFQYGERFYSFRGLYSFKDKFEPVWEARYLAAPGGVVPLLVLLDLAQMIGGGKGARK